MSSSSWKEYLGTQKDTGYRVETSLVSSGLALHFTARQIGAQRDADVAYSTMLLGGGGRLLSDLILPLHCGVTPYDKESLSLNINPQTVRQTDS